MRDLTAPLATRRPPGPSCWLLWFDQLCARVHHQLQKVGDGFFNIRHTFLDLLKPSAILSCLGHACLPLHSHFLSECRTSYKITSLKTMFLELTSDEQITKVGHELHSRGFGYAALDRRRQYMFVGTSLRNLQEGIDVHAKEEIGRTSMYDSAARTSCKRGYAGSFRFERCERDELPALVQQHRARFERVIICASGKSAWKLENVDDMGKASSEKYENELVIESDL